MRRWVFFVIGVLCIAAPTGYFAVHVFWMIWRYIHPAPFGEVHSEATGFVTTIALLGIAVGSSLFGGWFIRMAHGEDERPHSLFSN
jgi:hypothetical protein